jgi:aryl-alcohol dehydrogenase-like predicted oxidoreductase
MRNITLGSTGITVPQNAFGALPIQRISAEDAAGLLKKAYEGGMRFFDTARAYSDSEEKMGLGLSDVRENIYIASKTAAKTPEGFWKDLETTLHNLKTDYLDIYQFHCADRGMAQACTKPCLRQKPRVRSVILVSQLTRSALPRTSSNPVFMRPCSSHFPICLRTGNWHWWRTAASTTWALLP